MSTNRYTLDGGPQVESRIEDLVRAVAAEVENRVSSASYRALLLIGGYGRGEGGVEVRDGAEHPHNNLDFLLADAAIRFCEVSLIFNSRSDALTMPA